MAKRTTIEIDEDLLARAKRALGERTTRGAVEEALRRVADDGEGIRDRRAAAQLEYLEKVAKRVELTALRAEEMWR